MCEIRIRKVHATWGKPPSSAPYLESEPLNFAVRLQICHYGRQPMALKQTDGAADARSSRRGPVLQEVPRGPGDAPRSTLPRSAKRGPSGDGLQGQLLGQVHAAEQLDRAVGVAPDQLRRLHLHHRAVTAEAFREIARQPGRAPSRFSRELRRNAAARSGGFEYRAMTAQWHADRSARRPKPAKRQTNPALRQYVQDRLAGNIATSG
jgi:hypothetical protein